MVTFRRIRFRRHGVFDLVQDALKVIMRLFRGNDRDRQRFLSGSFSLPKLKLFPLSQSAAMRAATAWLRSKDALLCDQRRALVREAYETEVRKELGPSVRAGFGPRAWRNLREAAHVPRLRVQKRTLFIEGLFASRRSLLLIDAAIAIRQWSSSENMRLLSCWLL